MAIFVRCPACKSEQSIRKKKRVPKKCKNEKCGKPLPRKDKKFRIVVKYNKQMVRVSVPTALETARNIEEKIRTELVEGTYYDRKKKKKPPTLNEVWDKYFSWSKEMTKSPKTCLSRYNSNIKKRLGDKRLDVISQMNISKLMLDLKQEGKAPKGIRDIIELINRLYNYAKKQGLYRGDNPVTRVTRPKIPQRKPEYLTPHQLNALRQACDDYQDQQVGNLVKFLILTGRRRGEAFKLLWDDVDLERGIYTIRDPKGGRDEILELSEKALDVLKNQAELSTGSTAYVFPGRKGNKRCDIQNPWKEIKKMAGLPPTFRLHALRHNFASTLANKGVNPDVLQKLLMHSSPRMTQQYSHLFPDTKKQALQIMDQALDDALLKEKDKKAAS